MPFSLQIKDYIIAGLVLALSILGGYSYYLNNNLNIKKSIIEKTSLLAKVQKEKIAILKRQSKSTEEYLNEKYNVELTILNNTIDGMRKHSRTSIMPSIPPSSKDPSTACFSRKELDAAIQRYRAGVQGLVGKGAEATIGLNIAKEWVDKEKKIYEFR